MKLIREHIIFEKFTDESDPIADMRIGGNVNFEKKALKTIRNEKIRYPGDRREKWSTYLRSLEGKSITGVFEKVSYARAKTFSKTDRITFIINTFESYLDGTELYFYNKKSEATSSVDARYDIYKVLPEEYYLIK